MPNTPLVLVLKAFRRLANDYEDLSRRYEALEQRCNELVELSRRLAQELGDESPGAAWDPESGK